MESVLLDPVGNDAQHQNNSAEHEDDGLDVLAGMESEYPVIGPSVVFRTVLFVAVTSVPKD